MLRFALSEQPILQPKNFAKTNYKKFKLEKTVFKIQLNFTYCDFIQWLNTVCMEYIINIIFKNFKHFYREQFCLNHAAKMHFLLTLHVYKLKIGE